MRERCIALSSPSSAALCLSVAARYIGTEQPAKYQLSDKSMSARAAAQIIKDECLLDGNPTMNLASFVTTWSGRQQLRQRGRIHSSKQQPTQPTAMV